MSNADAFDIERQTTKLSSNLLTSYEKNIPHIIKYMGSKKSILDFVVDAISNTYVDGRLCDLFGGSSILSGALGKNIPIHANDIQEYSAILANTYLSSYNWKEVPPTILEDIIGKATEYVLHIKTLYPELNYSYNDIKNIEEFVEIEKIQQNLINLNFDKLSHHLFIKYYSGTYWSNEQCIWIDAIRKVAEEYKNNNLYFIIISSLMYAMSYNSQSTGHYAQYREATNLSSKTDILIYRKKEIIPFFVNKFNALRNYLKPNPLDHKVTVLDYLKCLEQIEPGTLVYADPPYAFVHYSRFYHALETLVKYDYPEVEYKGRYRTDRHQSPFCKKSEVEIAFVNMFLKIKSKDANLILSYSNTGMISLNQILQLATNTLGAGYTIKINEIEYTHSTMGRRDDKSRNVQEYLIIAKHD